MTGTTQHPEQFQNEDDWAEHIRQEVEVARAASPQHTWLLEEPAGQPPVIDTDGFAWIYEWDGDDVEDRDDPDARCWRRQVWTLIGNGDYMEGPTLDMEWSDVLSHGPIRLAEPADRTGWVYLWHPEGWKDGAPQGEPLRFTNAEAAIAAALPEQ